MDYEYHEIANLYELMDGEEFRSLCDNIRERGLKNPIVLYDGKILDGRNRYRACKELGIEPRFIQSSASTFEDAYHDVVTDNSMRRDLTPSQKAVLGFRMLPMHEKMAKPKQAHGMTGPGRTLEVTRPQAFSQRAPQSRDRAAKDSRASASSIQRVKRVHSIAPELVDAISTKIIKVSQAVTLADEDKATRDAVISLLSSGDAANFKQALASVKAPQVIQDDTAGVTPSRDEETQLVIAGEQKAPEVSRLPSLQLIDDVKQIQDDEAIRETQTGVPQALVMSSSNEWYTPSEYVEAARRVMGSIDLDPASCEQANSTVKAKTYYTKADDGLSRPWFGNVWMNPPYGKDRGLSNQMLWTRQLLTRYEQGDVDQAVFLVNSKTGESWFKPLWEHAICFVSRRIRFISPRGESKDPTHSSVVVYLGDNIDAFKEAFRAYGQIVIGEADDPGISSAKRA